MISQRRVAQLGLLAAASVMVMCLGVLVSQGNNASESHPQVVKAVDEATANSASLPMSLSSLTQARR
jgi:hypothetical protein